MENVKICQYRHCTKTIEGRSNKKFCGHNCRTYENMINKRERDKYKEEKNHIYTILETFKNGVDDATVELYKKLYKKL